MTHWMWLTLWSTAIATASVANSSAAETGRGPVVLTAAAANSLYAGYAGGVQAPTQAPKGAPIQAPGKGPIQAPMQVPIQAPKAAPAPQIITKTIMVPHTTFKTITVPQTILRPEVRQRTVTVPRSIPETHFETRVHTIMVPEVRTRTETFQVCRMTFETVERPITVMVPHTEMRQGVRTVCQPVPVQVSKTVCRDMGGWDTKSYVDCHGCVQTCSVYMPNIVTEQVPVTVMRPQMVEVPFSYPETVCRPETRMISERIPRPVYETQTREVPFTVPVPKQIEKQVPITTFRKTIEQKVVHYTEMVPHTIERTVQVPVCTMVPKTISYTLPPPCDTCGFGAGPYGGFYGSPPGKY